MLTITQTPEFVLPFGTVAAACPPALSKGDWRLAPSEQPVGSVQGRISEIAPSGYARGVEPVERQAALVAAGNGGADLLKHPFITMSRRDHRTWRPPH